MFDRTSQFIAGRWVESAGDRVVEVVSPVTEQVVGRVPVATTDEVDAAVAAARAAFDAGPWPRLPLAERAGRLRRFVEALLARRSEAIDLQIREMGATRTFTTMTLASVPGFLEQMIADADRIGWREVRTGSVGKVVVLREPLGVTAAVTPWNAPLMVVLSKVLPSLLMGCPIVVKPAPEAPLSPYLLGEAALDADLPAGLLSIVNGGADIGAYLVGHPGVDSVTFTGSVGGGRAIGATCAELIRPVTLELGGKSAALVCKGVDMAPYLQSLVDSSIRNSGQMCISTNRVLVHDSQRDELVGQLVETIAGLKLGDPNDEDTYFGPLCSARQRDIVESYVASGLAQGARIACGGKRPEAHPTGWFFEPTVFFDVDNAMRIAQEEIFGPVLSVISYAAEDEAIAIANDSAFGLGGAVFAPDPEHGLEVARRIVTGTCAVNGGPPSGGGGPFGGRKQSGLGRERSVEGLESFLAIKSVALPAGYEPDETS
ncbi:MAG TPA: aldehyde dehydrogenase family protein [Sporichthyaceae bacterium]|jgi:betaine-aldehyde dehydrogenase